jgi:hypothetical protein
MPRKRTNRRQRSPSLETKLRAAVQDVMPHVDIHQMTLRNMRRRLALELDLDLDALDPHHELVKNIMIEAVQQRAMAAESAAQPATSIAARPAPTDASMSSSQVCNNLAPTAVAVAASDVGGTADPTSVVPTVAVTVGQGSVGARPVDTCGLTSVRAPPANDGSQPALAGSHPQTTAQAGASDGQQAHGAATSAATQRASFRGRLATVQQQRPLSLSDSDEDSSSSSGDSTSSSQSAPALSWGSSSDSDGSDPFAESDLFKGDGEVDSDAEDDLPVDLFHNLRSATKGECYTGHTVHFWTFPHTEKPVNPSNCSKKKLARLLKEVYGVEQIKFYCIVRELHANSVRSWERKAHYHVVLKLAGRVKPVRIARELRSKGLYGHLCIPKRHVQFWPIMSYVYCPSLKKPLGELDPDPYLSSEFPVSEIEKRFAKAMSGRVEIRPWEMFHALKKLGCSRYGDLVDWCEMQAKRGLPQFQKFLVRQRPKMKALFVSWLEMIEKPLQHDGHSRAIRLQIWEKALGAECVCVTPNRLSNALQSCVDFHGKDATRFAFMLERMLRVGTSLKNSNILLWGASNAGKTAVTRPLIYMFGDRCWLRPSAGDTFPLQGLEQKVLGVWQDWRVETSPVPWDTLLLVLEGESVTCAVKGLPSVICHHPPPMVITAQKRIAHLDGSEVERQAFVNRFALRWHLKKPLERKDEQLKLCYKCTGCYARWIRHNAAQYKFVEPDAEHELVRMEQALKKQHDKEDEERQSFLQAACAPLPIAVPATPDHRVAGAGDSSAQDPLSPVSYEDRASCNVSPRTPSSPTHYL